MAGGRDDERLVEVVRELCAELGGRSDGAEPDEAPSRELWEELGEAADGLVSQLRHELTRLGLAALGEGEPKERRALRSALDGAELVMRGEIAAKRRERLAEQLPGIAFVVVLPGLGRERALALSRRAAELLDLGPATA